MIRNSRSEYTWRCKEHHLSVKLGTEIRRKKNALIMRNIFRNHSIPITEYRRLFKRPRTISSLTCRSHKHYLQGVQDVFSNWQKSPPMHSVTVHRAVPGSTKMALTFSPIFILCILLACIYCLRCIDVNSIQKIMTGFNSLALSKTP